MRILLSIAFFTVCCFQLKAQTKIAVKGGFNYSTARAYYGDVKKSTGFIPGGNIAIQLKTEFEGVLHFSPYIAYSTRGYIIKEGNGTSDKIQTFIHYIDIAPVLSVDLPAGKNNSFVIAAGPLAGVALAGTEKKTINGVTSSAKMNFTTSKDYGFFDLGLHTSVGYHINKFFVEIAYQYGFVSINNNEETDKKNIRNRSFSLNVGYFFKTYK